MDNYIIEVLKIVADMVVGVSWPIVAGLALWLAWKTRDQLIAILSALAARIENAKVGNVGVGFVAPDQQDFARENPKIDFQPLPPNSDPNFRPAVDKIEARLKQILDNQPHEKEALYLRVATENEVALLLERVNYLIYGSQIQAIELLDIMGQPAPVNILQHIYDDAKQKYPQIYAAYPFESWLAFMQMYQMIQIEQDNVSLTEEGKAFVPYLSARGYQKERIG